MEAFVLGCPVIATDCVGLKEVVEGTPAMRIKSKDCYSIVNALKKVMKNPISIKEKGLKFIPEAKDRYNVEKTARQLEDLFERVMSSRPI
jgi:glycosyltransferase involved in cell wall biosynthesis